MTISSIEFHNFDAAPRNLALVFLVILILAGVRGVIGCSNWVGGS